MRIAARICLLLVGTGLGIVNADGTPVAAYGCESAATGDHGSTGSVHATPSGFEAEGEQHYAEQSAGSTCPSNSEPDFVVEVGCGAVSYQNDGCEEMVCPGGDAWMMSYPIVNGEPDRNNGYGFCADDEAPPQLITSTAVLQGLRRIGLPAGELSIQPPGGKTLVNLETVFSTNAPDSVRTIRVAGVAVEVRIWPSTFTWHWGDGMSLQTADPGREYEPGVPMRRFLTHEYTEAAKAVRPRVDVTYEADYRVGNNGWQPVIGTVTIPGVSAELSVLEARPVLVGTD